MDKEYETVMLTSVSESDLDLIYNLNHTIFKDEITYDKEFIKRLCRLKQGYIAYINNVPTGYILFGMTICKNERYFTIISIGVLSNFRGKNIGKKLLFKVCEQYSDKDIILHVRPKNTAAQNLYKSAGFAIIDIEENYYPQLNDNAYHMLRKGNLA